MILLNGAREGMSRGRGCRGVGGGVSGEEMVPRVSMYEYIIRVETDIHETAVVLSTPSKQHNKILTRKLEEITPLS